jgi:DnaK suppressor protein
MKPGQLNQLRLMLAWRRQALIAELRRDVARTRGEPFGEIAGTAPDLGEASGATLLADVGQAELSRDVIELRGVEAALTRMSDGAYGICIDCGADVGFERLRAEPAAARCVECQTRHEKTYRA